MTHGTIVMTVRTCDYLPCGAKLAQDAHARQRYCDNVCRQKAYLNRRQGRVPVPTRLYDEGFDLVRADRELREEQLAIAREQRDRALQGLDWEHVPSGDRSREARGWAKEARESASPAAAAPVTNVTVTVEQVDSRVAEIRREVGELLAALELTPDQYERARAWTAARVQTS